MKKNLKKVISLVSAFAIMASTFTAFAAEEEVAADAATEAAVEETVVEETAAEETTEEVAEEATEEVAEEAAAGIVGGVPSDVVGTAYEQAVKELVALNVVAGYEDGTFKPDNNITRAEVTTLVVKAMGPTYLENALAAAGKDTDFTDVPGTHWAAGYVSTGVANSFIAGMGDGTFAPEENVTYAQIVKMIIAAMGYTSICEKQGGYPNGYLSVASSTGVTAGVTANGADSIVTRGQVAQLLDNAVKLPIVQITGYEESEYTGQLIAKTQIMDEIDGSDAKNYQTLLTKNHDAYVVKGRILATPQSTKGDLDKGEVRFRVEASKNFDDVAYGDSYYKVADDAIGSVMYYDGADAADMMFVYAEAILAKDDNDEFTILTLTAAGKNETVALETALYDTFDYVDANDTTKGIYSIDMYTSADSSKTKTYKLNPTHTQIYVNGVPQGTATATNIENYIEKNNNGVVTLIDATETGKTTTDGKVDYLLVTYYADAIVDSVQVNASNYRVYWKESNNAISKGLKIDPEDDDVVVNYYKNGEAIDYTDLKEYDVVSVAYDVANWENSTFYDVYVSDTKVTGKVTGATENSNDEMVYSIGGEDYTASYSRYAGAKNILTVGTEYVLYLNAFGSFAYYDEDSTSKVIGIIDFANIDSSDTPKIRIITSAGTKVSYTVKDNSKTRYNEIASKFFTTVPTTGAATGKKSLDNLIAEYTINSNGYITSATPVDSPKAIGSTGAGVEYKESTQKFGSLALAESTVIIDLSENTASDIAAQDYSKVGATTVADLEDGADYVGFAAEKSTSDGTYRFVVITEAGSQFTGNTAIAVYSKGGSVYDDMQATSVNTIVALADGQEDVELKLDSACNYTYETTPTGSRGNAVSTTVIGDEDGETVPALKRGDIFIYDTDSDNYVTDVKILFNGLNDSYATFLNNALNASLVSFDSDILFTNNLYPVSDWLKTDSSTKSGKVGMVFGPVIDKVGSSVTIANPTADGKVNINTGVEDVTVVSGAKIYVYDYSESKADRRLSIGNVGSIIKTSVPADYKSGAEQEVYQIATATTADGVTTFANTEFAVNFIVAKTVDDDITEALVILGNV